MRKDLELSIGTISGSWLIGILMAFSLFGMILHNRFEFPAMPLLNPEYVIPSLFSLALFLGYSRQPRYQRVWAWLILLWGLLHLIGGGIISVLPLAFLPFEPEQSVSHYRSHVIYGITQFPLVLYLGFRLISDWPEQDRSG